MADNLTDEELARELRTHGETVKLPIKAAKRGVLIKKLNHLRVKAEKEQSEVFKRPTTVSRPRRGTRSPRSAIASFSSDESDVGDPDSQARVTGRKKLKPAGRRASTRLSGVVDGVKNAAGSPVLNSVKHESNVISSNPNQLHAPFLSSGRRSASPSSPAVSVESQTGQTGTVLGIELGNLGRSIFSPWNRNTNYNSRSKPVEFDSSDSDVADDSTYVAESRGINTSFNLDESDNQNLNSETGSFGTNWLRNRGSKENSSNEKNNSSTSPFSTSTPVRESWHRTSENHSPTFDNSPLYKQNSSASVIRQQLNSSRPSHVSAEKMAEDQRLQRVFKAKEQSLKVNYNQHISMVLLVIVGVFFLVLSVLYLSMKESSDIPVDDTKAANDLLICTEWRRAMAKGDENGENKKKPCFEEEVSHLAFKVISPLYDELSQRLGDYKCEKRQTGNMSRSELTDFIQNFLEQQKMYHLKGEMYTDVVTSLVIHNQHWHIRAMKDSAESAQDMSEADKVVFIESTVPYMSLSCRILKAIRRVTNQILLAFAVVIFLIVAGCITIYVVHYRVKRQEVEQKLVYDMVEKIIDVLKLHCETLHDEEDDKPYLAIQHVRDTLIPPSQRKQFQYIWNKAVKFVELHESRVRVETQTIHGEDFIVWRWLQNCPKGQKVWQGQAFGEDKLNHVAKSSSPCLKVSNMFNADKENEDDWDISVQDAILEKCSDCQIVHLTVDRGSNEGVVYVKCCDARHAGKAFKQLHGWWFDGKLVTVKYLKLEHYNRSFPMSVNCVEPLQPTTDRRLSLAQPFHRSSLEMT